MWSKLLPIVLVGVSLFMGGSLGGCKPSNEGSERAGEGDEAKGSARVTLYTSIDEPFARELVGKFESRTGIRVTLVTDAEATKTAGLAEKLLAEKASPRADVYWGNEPFHTIRLAAEECFSPYSPPSASELPEQFKDNQGRWTSVGYRARVLAVSGHEKFADSVRGITSLHDLTDPRFKGGQVGGLAIAAPATGTTSGHLAALYTVWGEERFRAWVSGLKANNIRIVGGNAVSARLVGDGTLAVGLTDNDDVRAMAEGGGKLTQVVPDQEPGQIGTLLVPTTIGLVAGSPNPEAGKKLLDFLTSPETEMLLVEKHFLQGSLKDIQSHKIKAMQVDLTEVARNMRIATEIALTILQDR